MLIPVGLSRPAWRVLLLVSMLALPVTGYDDPRTHDGQASTTPPTLARLSFRVPPERMAELAAACQSRLVPILAQHGLVESPARGRTTPDSVFSRLFAVSSPAEVSSKRTTLGRDPAWASALQDLAADPAAVGLRAPVRHELATYHCPAGGGSTVTAGAGVRRGLWLTLDRQDGLPGAWVNAVLQDRDGLMCAAGAAVTRYDGATFTTFTTLTSRDGLPDSYARSVTRDRSGCLWLGTLRGLARYDGRAVTSLVGMDDLAGVDAQSLAVDDRGTLWCAGTHGDEFPRVWQAIRYDGRAFTVLTDTNGVPISAVSDLLVDHKGDLWLASDQGGTRYDGQRCRRLTGSEGLASETVCAVVEDQAGNLRFGTAAGASRYDGAKSAAFGRRDGLGFDRVARLAVDRQGQVWLGGGYGEPVSRYDGRTFTALSTNERLPGGLVSMAGDLRGHMSSPVFGSGLVRYDGRVMQHLTQREGLATDGVQAVYEDTLAGDPCYWIATDDGVTRYWPLETSPELPSRRWSMIVSTVQSSNSPCPRHSPGCSSSSRGAVCTHRRTAWLMCAAGRAPRGQMASGQRSTNPASGTTTC